MKKALIFFVAIFMAIMAVPVFAQGNPYGGGWSNCTWGAWELAAQNGNYLPGFGNAGSWLASASKMGYPVGSVPSANSIAVYSNHVVYVATYNGGDTMYIQEGGYLGGYNEGNISAYSGRDGQALLGFIYLNGYYPVENETNYIEEIKPMVLKNNVTNNVQKEEPLIEEIYDSNAGLIEVIPGINVAISIAEKEEVKSEETAVVDADNSVEKTENKTQYLNTEVQQNKDMLVITTSTIELLSIDN